MLVLQFCLDSSLSFSRAIHYLPIMAQETEIAAKDIHVGITWFLVRVRIVKRGHKRNVHILRLSRVRKEHSFVISIRQGGNAIAPASFPSLNLVTHVLGGFLQFLHRFV
ncbi:unnamed protein product [Chondrus crispus]|uniref:Uncharacterized protein n=1 Tax=Chondrus crispus TaxID=2769 RepID=R7QI60_CHOCR|nr:unnamed protein product [Chondrus crispus]CDF37156.1 unnamed protein product [Chondrus crispus]|eukprot:XP_005716975.1 unnamed protein product [Chondrus crispus]